VEDRDYLYRRAEEEVYRASAATAQREASFHYQLAELFLERIYGAQGNPRAAACWAEA
jgi:hypothetical protein